jgi:hypothetical protein
MSRSPKDAVLESQRFKQLLALLLPKQVGDLNADGLAFYRAVQEASEMHSGAEAIDLLCRSTRVWNDVKVRAANGFFVLSFACIEESQTERPLQVQHCVPRIQM